VPAALYLLALAGLFVSMARPVATVRVPKEQATVVLVMDVSGSMNATDVQPSRLTAAQNAAKAFVGQLPKRFKVGLVVFSTTATTLTRPTTDRPLVTGGLDSLLARGGTAMGDAIQEGLIVARGGQIPAPAQGGAQATPAPQPEPAKGPPAVLLLLSDGASTVGRSPLDVADDAHRQGVSIYTVALGTQTGVVEVPDRTGIRRRVRVPPDETTLQRIADVTDGRFFKAPSDKELQAVYKELGSRIGFEKGEQEITALFSAGAVVLLLGGGILSLLWLNRFP
jgi:Ca-activated chloride channel family protein